MRAWLPRCQCAVSDERRMWVHQRADARVRLRQSTALQGAVMAQQESPLS